MDVKIRVKHCTSPGNHKTEDLSIFGQWSFSSVRSLWHLQFTCNEIIVKMLPSDLLRPQTRFFQGSLTRAWYPEIYLRPSCFLCGTGLQSVKMCVELVWRSRRIVFEVGLEIVEVSFIELASEYWSKILSSCS